MACLQSGFILACLGGGLAVGLITPDVMSLSLFVLGLLGMGYGLNRGFYGRLAPAEKWVLSAAVILALTAMICFAFGRETHIGFHILGRELRILLLVPVYVLVRTQRLNGRRLGWMLGLGALSSAIYSLGSLWIQGIAHRVSGVTGVPIVFGDLALLTGTLAAWLVIPKNRLDPPARRWREGSLALIFLASGIFASLASGTRGAWIAIPVLLVIGGYAFARRVHVEHPGGLIAVIVMGTAGSVLLALLPGSPLQSRILRAADQTMRYVNVNALPMLTGERPQTGCLNRPRTLERVRHYILTAPPLDRGDLSLTILRPGSAPPICSSNAAYTASVRYSTDWLTIDLETTSRRPGFHDLAILARGQALFQVGTKGPVTFIHSRAFQTYWSHGRSGRFSPILLHLHPGWKLTFIPLTTYPWEFSYDPSANSIGNRIALWDVALRLFARHPWLGGGTGSFASYADQAERQRLVPPVVWNYQHAHNDFLNQLATEGLLGFAALLLFYGTILHAYRQDTRPEAFDAHVFLMLFVAGLAIFGLTETLWIHSLVVDWIALMVAAGLAISSPLALPSRESLP
ncbi:MAG: O-antigen ligase family protein [Gammaproteobacteria bacterium]